jgi:hypothetical protein
MHHSPEMHQQLVERIPSVTGKSLREWHQVLDEGPSFIRPDERAAWLRDEHQLAPGFASAIVHEHELKRHRH